MLNLELFSEVALLQDSHHHGLVRGQVGTVVELFSPSAAEIEFCDDEGRTDATAALQSGKLMRLYCRPFKQVA